MARLANRLTQARQQHFVGRMAELELFRASLSRDVPDFAVLHLYGPGGMGKTTLLREFTRITEEAGRLPILLDALFLDENVQTEAVSIHFDDIMLCLEHFLPYFRA